VARAIHVGSLRAAAVFAAAPTRAAAAVQVRAAVDHVASLGLAAFGITGKTFRLFGILLVGRI
jgi:hypothetical protein